LQTVDGLGGFWPRAGEEVQRYERTQLLGLSRKFQRDNAIYQGVVRKSVGYIVGKGFKVQARTPDPRWNSQAEHLWKAWWAQPDVTGARSGLDVLKALCSELMVTGEAWALLTNRGTVQLMEAEQVAGDTPADNGVVKDASGFVTDYLVRSWDRMGTQQSPVKVRADFIACAQHLDRPSCERGVPVGQSVFAMLHRVNDVLDSEALSWQMISRIALAWLTQQEVDPNTGEAIISDPAANPLDQIFEGDTALIVRGLPGDEIRAIDRNIPGKDFPQSIRMFLRLIGVPFGMPLEFILLDWTGGNYTQGRAVMEQTYAGFEATQALIKRIVSKIYVWKLGEWVKMGLLPRAEYWAAHEIFTPSWPWLDQLKEIQAATESVEGGLCTHTEVLARLNKDREEFLVLQEKETIEAIAIAKRIETDTGVKVDWKIFAGRAAGKTEAAVKAGEPPAEDPVEEPDTDTDTEEGATDED
jgi:capsid protein